MRQTLITLLFILPWLASAQDSIPSFSLDQAITYALEHNYTAQNAERDILDAQKQKWETIASGLPQINGAVSYQNQLKQPVAQIPAEFFWRRTRHFSRSGLWTAAIHCRHCNLDPTDF